MNHNLKIPEKGIFKKTNVWKFQKKSLFYAHFFSLHLTQHFDVVYPKLTLVYGFYCSMLPILIPNKPD